jgi:glucosamine--fructose-6-phosphate aminotransferase (isomerizing)
MAKTRFLEDVASQPQLLKGLLGPHREMIERPVAEATRLLEPRSRLVFVGMGSSLAAAIGVCPRLDRGGRFAVAVDAGEMLHYGLPGLVGDTGIVLISQSGRSAETVRLLESLPAAGRGAVAVTNDPDSPLATRAAVNVPLVAGDEQAVATKTYVATLLVLHMLADRMLGERATDLTRLSPALDTLSSIASRPELAEPWAEHLGAVHSLAIVGRGGALGLAHYAAVTIDESARLPALPFSGGAFRHGPLELTGPDLGVIVLAGPEPTRELQLRLAHDAEAGGARVLVLDTGADGAADATDGMLRIRLGEHDLVGGQLVTAGVLQLLAAALARRRGYEAGVMHYTSKVTDIE